MTLIPVTAELFYSDQWNDISQYGYNRAPVQVRRGASAEGSLTDPTELTMELDNRDGRWNTRHPNSPLRGLLGRNTPLRVSVGTPYPAAANSDTADTTDHVAPDLDAPAPGMLLCAFAAPDPGGSYTAPSGMTATATTSGSQLTIGGARQIIGSAGATGARTATFSAAEDYVSASVFIPGPSALTTGTLANATGLITVDGNAGDWWVLLVAYASSASAGTIPDGVEFRPHLDYPHDTDGGGWMALADTGSAFVADAQARYMRMRVYAKRVKHTNAAHIIKTALFDVPLWDQGDTERLAILARIPAAEVDLWSPRANVQVTKLSPRQGVDQQDWWADVRAVGILEQLATGKDRPLESPFRRTFGAVENPVVYWPMEDGTDAALLAAASRRGGPGRLVDDVTPGAYSGFVGSDPVPTLGEGDLALPIPSHVDGAEYHHLLLSIPDGGLPDEQQVYSLRMSNGGTWQVRYGTGGSFRLFAFDADDVEIDSTAPIGFDVDGADFFFQLALVQNGGNVDTTMRVWKTDGSFLTDVDSFATTLNQSIRARVGVGMNPSGMSAGHLIITKTDLLVGTSLIDIAAALKAFDGEQAGGRMHRLCREAGVPLMFVGDPAQTRIVGPQQRGTLLGLLRQAEAADHGILCESKEDFALVYRTGSSLSRLHGGTTAQQWVTQPVTAAVTTEADTDDAELAEPWEPEPDEFLIQNDVTVKRISGSSARMVRESGPLNVNDPANDPDGAGPFPAQVELNLHDDFRLPSHANELLRRGTVDEPRFPKIGVNLFKEHERDPDVALQAAALDPGDRFTVKEPPEYPDDVRQVVLGTTEALALNGWHLTVNCAPASPYVVGVRRDTSDTVGPDEPSRRDTAGSELDAEFVAGTDTSMDVLVTLGAAWGQTSDDNMDLPLDVEVGGVRLRVTAIGAPSAGVQSFTVDQTPVNSVTTPLTLPAGTAVRLWQPAVRALGGSEDA